MFETVSIIKALAFVVVLAPAVLLVVLGLTSLVDRPLGEARTARLVRWCVGVALVAAVGAFAGMLWTGDRYMALDFGNWVAVGNTDAAGTAPGHAPHYTFAVKFVFDRLSVPFLILALLLCGAVAHFATKY